MTLSSKYDKQYAVKNTNDIITQTTKRQREHGTWYSKTSQILTVLKQCRVLSVRISHGISGKKGALVLDYKMISGADVDHSMATGSSAVGAHSATLFICNKPSVFVLK